MFLDVSKGGLRFQQRGLYDIAKDLEGFCEKKRSATLVPISSKEKKR